jgi:glycosyltransferase involved in cell wall biosynthesis
MRGSANYSGHQISSAVSDMKVPISVLMPIKNEAANLPRSLASVRWADEIFVIDSHSSDASASIAQEHGAKVVQFRFNGTWPKKKNWALENLPFKHEWVFILDADEVLPAAAEEEFRGIASSANQDIAGYWINRRFMFLGKWLKHAYYPNWNLRLFKHRLGRYEKLTDIDTDSGDNEVHEHVVVEGKTGRVESEMDHYAFPSVDIFIQKHNRYSNWEARVALDRYLKGSSQALQSRDVGLRRRLKQFSQLLPCRPLLRFLYIYIWQGGFADGIQGYHFARLHGLYEYLCVAKTFELKSRKTAGLTSADAQAACGE